MVNTTSMNSARTPIFILSHRVSFRCERTHSLLFFIVSYAHPLKIFICRTSVQDWCDSAEVDPEKTSGLVRLINTTEKSLADVAAEVVRDEKLMDGASKVLPLPFSSELYLSSSLLNSQDSLPDAVVSKIKTKPVFSKYHLANGKIHCVLFEFPLIFRPIRRTFRN